MIDRVKRTARCCARHPNGKAVGAIVGTCFGGPVGTVVGMAIGGAVSGLISSAIENWDTSDLVDGLGNLLRGGKKSAFAAG